MEKELKSCRGVLLRADLKGHGYPILFRRLAWMAIQYSLQQICLPPNFFAQACIAVFSTHSNLLYDDDKYANETMYDM